MALYERSGVPYFDNNLLSAISCVSIEALEAIFKDNSGQLRDGFGATLLHYAAQFNNTSITKFFIKKKHNVNAIDTFGNTPIMWALTAGSVKTMMILLENGATVQCGIDDNTIFREIPIYRQHFTTKDMKYFLKKLKKVCDNDEELLVTRLVEFHYALNDVILLNNGLVTSMFLNYGYPIDRVYLKTNRTALQVAVIEKDLASVRLLIHRGAYVNATMFYKANTLWCKKFVENYGPSAVDLEIVKFILENTHPWLLRLDYYHMHALGFFFNAKKDMLRVVLPFVDLSEKNYDRETPLHRLIHNPHHDILELLEDRVYDINALNAKAYTPLHVAVRLFDVNKTEYLLNHGANPNIPKHNGHTPLFSILRDFNKMPEIATKIVNLLLQHGADVLHSLVTEDDVGQLTIAYSESVLAHVALMNSVGIDVGTFLQFIRNPEAINYYNMCNLLIHNLQITWFHGNLTLYQLLTLGQRDIEGYARDVEFVSKFQYEFNNTKGRNLYQLEPYYLNTIKKKVGKIISHVELIIKATEVITRLFNLNVRGGGGGFDVATLIVRLLDERDLIAVSRVFEDWDFEVPLNDLFTLGRQMPLCCRVFRFIISSSFAAGKRILY